MTTRLMDTVAYRKVGRHGLLMASYLIRLVLTFPDDGNGIRKLLSDSLDVITDDRVRVFCVAAQVVDVDQKSKTSGAFPHPAFFSLFCFGERVINAVAGPNKTLVSQVLFLKKQLLTLISGS